MKQISTYKFRKIFESGKDLLLIDVRDKSEFNSGHIPTAKNIPLCDIEDFSDEIPLNKDVYFICTHGNKSARAVTLLNNLDIENVINIQGGMLCWDGKIEK